MALTGNRFYLALAGLNGVLALAHTAKGHSQFKDIRLNKLPTTLRGAVQTGWYEGSLFFAIMGVLNYKWAQIGFGDVFDKSIAGIYTTLLLGAGTSYASTGDATTGVVLSLAGILQGVALWRA